MTVAPTDPAQHTVDRGQRVLAIGLLRQPGGGAVDGRLSDIYALERISRESPGRPARRGEW